MRVSSATLLLVASLTACADQSALGPAKGALRLYVTLPRSVINVGDSTTAVITLQNLGARRVTIGFSSSCQILPYIAAQPGDEIVYPGGGHWVCADVITELTLPPFATKTQTLLLRGGASSGSGGAAVALDRGDYLINASLASHESSLHADPVPFTVR